MNTVALVGKGNLRGIGDSRSLRPTQSDDHVAVDEALRRCVAANLPQPSVVVNSGNGAHVYWLLTEALLIDDAGGNPVPAFTEFVDQCPDKKKKTRKFIIDQPTQERLYLDVRSNVPPLSPKAQYIQDINAGIASKIGGDHTTDLSRLLRVPGTLSACSTLSRIIISVSVPYFSM